MYEELIEAVKKDLSNKSKEELLDIAAQLVAACVLSMSNTCARIVGGETVELINNQIEVNQESMKIKEYKQ